MPKDPRTWSQFDQVTATRLNGDLYAYQGYAFYPNGIQFHARKPVYKAIQATPGLDVGAGNWRGMFETQGANVIVDDSGYYGTLMDPDYSGTIADTLSFSNGGNSPTGGGGWYLISAFTPLSGGSTGTLYRTNFTSQASWASGATPALLSAGSALQGNSNRDIAPFCVDLVNMDGGSVTPVVQNEGTSSVDMQTTTDGSGETCRFAAHWVSVWKQNGHTASSAPAPKASWAGTDTVTASLLNGSTGIRDVLRVLNMPPCLRVTATTTTTCANNNPQVINLGNATFDTYNAWNAGSNTYTVPFSGLYFAYGLVTFQPGGSSVPARCSVTVNGTNYWGPYGTMQSGNDNGVPKIIMLDLNAGDTVQLVGEQNSGSSIPTSSSIPPVLVLAWMGSLTAPSPLPSLPDLSWRYTAGMGTAATLSAFNGHLANDLNFLCHKPLLMSSQVTAQSIPVNGTGTKVTMDTVGGIVHGTAGDPWGGWDATNHRYVAPVTGWYLATTEIFFNSPSLTTSPSTVALLGVSTSGTAQFNWDWYGHQNLPTSFNPGGAAGMGYYLLRAGDWIAPGVITQDTAASNFSTNGGTRLTHFECVFVSEA